MSDRTITGEELPVRHHIGCMTALAAAITIMALAVCGCIYKGAKVVEGTDLAVGFTIPGTDGAAQMDVLNCLSGFRLGVAENAALKVKYTVAETNDYLGVVHIRSLKTIDAKVEPCETSTPENNAKEPSDK